MEDLTFLLGASDMEMDAIERLLKDKGLAVRHAQSFNPREGTVMRCFASNAYRAVDGLCPDTGKGITDITRVVMIECGIPGITPMHRIDHHNPGDPGHAAPPSDYWKGSSIGQVVTYLSEVLGLEVEVTDELRYIAAGDHCPAHAYRGLCPGVDPKGLMEFRAAKKAKFQKMPLETLLAEIENGKERLLSCSRINMAGVDVALTGDERIPQLPEVCMILGLAAEYTLVGPDGRTKVGLIGSTSPAVIQKWMEMAPERGLVDVYGSPERGYCGGYRP